MAERTPPTASTGIELAEQIALWADRIRDMTATGLRFSKDIYDRQRYEALQQMALEMLGVATAQPVKQLEPLRTTVFARPTPVVVGNAAVIDANGTVLLMRRTDVGLWALPGGFLEVGETPSEGIVREALEETGVVCEPVALVGIYDSRIWDVGVGRQAQHLYKLTFLCRPLNRGQEQPASHAHEALETGWFAEQDLPPDLYQGHVQRLRDAYRVWRGDRRAHCD